MTSEVFDFSSPGGKALMRNLYAFSLALFNRLYKTEVNERGKSFKDYVHDAIEKHLLQEDRYDPAKSPLEYHLKYHVIRRAIYNDLPAGVKKLHKETAVSQLQESNLIPERQSTPARMTLAAVGYDQALILKEVEEKVNNDAVMESIYLAVCEDTFDFSDRQEICNAYTIAPEEFDKGIKRFRTVLKRVFQEFKIKGIDG